jgi:hypothetical protein
MLDMLPSPWIASNNVGRRMAGHESGSRPQRCMSCHNPYPHALPVCSLRRVSRVCPPLGGVSSYLGLEFFFLVILSRLVDRRAARTNTSMPGCRDYLLPRLTIDSPRALALAFLYPLVQSFFFSADRNGNLLPLNLTLPPCQHHPPDNTSCLSIPFDST